ncbi:MAG: twin-arginine translocase TatA/TatE family subunit [Phycisphaerales bacterium]
MLPSASPTLALFNLGGMEWVIILVIGLLLFGSRLPSVGRNIGKSITEFKKGMKDAQEDIQNEVNAPVASSQSGQAARPQLSQEQQQLMERATQEALNRLRAEQAAQQTQK